MLDMLIIYLIIIFKKTFIFSSSFFQVGRPVLDIILVHGIKGGAGWTWREHDQGKFKPLISQEDRRNILTGQHGEGNTWDVDLFTYILALKFGCALTEFLYF